MYLSKKGIHAVFLMEVCPAAGGGEKGRGETGSGACEVGEPEEGSSSLGIRGV